MVVVCVALGSSKVVFWKPFAGILTLVCVTPPFIHPTVLLLIYHTGERDRESNGRRRDLMEVGGGGDAAAAIVAS
ncbi:hypothetical protein Hdeb2414_s0021g00573161 [Helianthus debilis subsp. tardiflorus]